MIKITMRHCITKQIDVSFEFLYIFVKLLLALVKQSRLFIVYIRNARKNAKLNNQLDSFLISCPW